MKKIFLFRVTAVIIFSIMTLAIKSETSACKATCICASDNNIKNHPVVSGDAANGIDDKYEIFFIKI